MPIANEFGVVTSLPSKQTTGTIKLEREGIVISFANSTASSEFRHAVVGPLEVGKRVRVWAVKLSADATHTATLIQSDAEPLSGSELFLALQRGDESVACAKAILDPLHHADRERQDKWLEEQLARS